PALSCISLHDALPISGTEELRPRWKRAVSLVNSSLGEDVGRLYVAKHYTESHRHDMDQLVDALQHAYATSIAQLPWMGEDTRKLALAILSKFNPMIGYPVRWHDYSDIERSEERRVGKE